VFSSIRRKLIAGVLAGAMLVGTVSAASADNRDFQFTNSSGWTVDELYVSPSAIEDWGVDILGPDVVMPQGSVANVTFTGFNDGSCLYDIKVIFSDHDQLYALGFDLCTVVSVELGADDVFYYQ
jgi:hypothetical protein